MASQTITLDRFPLLADDASKVAPLLLGCELHSTVDGQLVRVKIVEVEAYDQTDVASHSYHGKTERTKVMFGERGHLYVYFTYGMHYCANIVTGEEGYGSGVLIRAVEPLEGRDVLERRRRMSGVAITNGPAKLCQALGIDMGLSGHDLARAPLQLVTRPALESNDIVTTTRIGISKGRDIRWRFYIKDNSYVSVK